MIGLNLLPDIKKEFIKAQRTRNTVISLSILAMFIVGGLTVFLALFVYVGQQTAINLTTGSIQDKQKTLQGKPEIGKYLTIQNQLDALAVLHNDTNKVTYSRLFDYLVKLNPAQPYQVSLGSAKIARQTTTIDIQGSTKDFQSLDVFKNTLQNAKIAYKLNDQAQDTVLFSDVTLKSASLSQANGKTGVSFEIIMTYKPEIFYPDITDIAVTVPKLTISDAQTNAPSELFNGTNGGSN